MWILSVFACLFDLSLDDSPMTPVCFPCVSCVASLFLFFSFFSPSFFFFFRCKGDEHKLMTSLFSFHFIVRSQIERRKREAKYSTSEAGSSEQKTMPPDPARRFLLL